MVNCSAKPSLQEELDCFKGIIRRITTHEVPKMYSKLFWNEERGWLRRLAKLGVKGPQPALRAVVYTTKEEKERIAECILQQKKAQSPMAMKEYKEYVARRQEQEGKQGSQQEEPRTFGEKLKLEIAKLATNVPVKWKRCFSTLVPDQTSSGE